MPAYWHIDGITVLHSVSQCYTMDHTMNGTVDYTVDQTMAQWITQWTTLWITVLLSGSQCCRQLHSGSLYHTGVGSKNRKTGKFQKTENRISGTRFFWILVIFLENTEKFGKFQKNRKPNFWASIFLEITDRDIGSVRTGYWS